MLEFYKITYYAIVNEEEIYGCSKTILCDSDKIKEGRGQIGIISWDCLNSLSKYNFAYNTHNTRKGKTLTMFPDWPAYGKIYKFKEWKEKINISIVEETYKIKVSLKKVLEWEDAEKAIQYLNEHGLAIKEALK